jgi:hypothetical protein
VVIVTKPDRLGRNAIDVDATVATRTRHSEDIAFIRDVAFSVSVFCGAASFGPQAA